MSTHTNVQPDARAFLNELNNQMTYLDNLLQSAVHAEWLDKSTYQIILFSLDSVKRHVIQKCTMKHKKT